MQTSQHANRKIKIDRVQVISSIFFLIGVVFLARLFYLQVIKNDHYRSLAKQEQFKQLEIEAERGSIYVRSGVSEPVLLTVNESRYSIIADPYYVVDKNNTAQELSKVLGIDSNAVKSQLDSDSRYQIIAKKVTKDTKTAVEGLQLKGIAWKEERIRTYPQGDLASHVTGFVNDDGEGQYGVEGYMNDLLSGKPGVIRAITDIEGVPLLQNQDNVVTEPINGQDILLSIDQLAQSLTEQELKSGVEKSGAKSGSAIIMEANTGRVVAMANYPSYSQTNYAKVEDSEIYKNQVVSDPFEPGSVIKTLTIATALDVGVVRPNSTYYDSSVQVIDGVSIRNVQQLGAGDRSVFDILHYSLNTGAIYLLKQFGGGEINETARVVWHDYLTKHFLFADGPYIEQQEAVIGVVHDPLEGDGLRVQYANMSFGQGLTVTLQQLASGLSSVVNGGTYYKPTVIYATRSNDQWVISDKVVLKENVISDQASREIVELMRQYVDVMAPEARRDGFITGGKTGTAQIPNPAGGYREDAYNATFVGYVGRESPKYVIAIRLNEGSSASNFSGFKDARPVFTAIVNGMMDGIGFTE